MFNLTFIFQKVIYITLVPQFIQALVVTNNGHPRMMGLAYQDWGQVLYREQ
jgi:hypothetical protein